MPERSRSRYSGWKSEKPQTDTIQGDKAETLHTWVHIEVTDTQSLRRTQNNVRLIKATTLFLVWTLLYVGLCTIEETKLLCGGYLIKRIQLEVRVLFFSTLFIIIERFVFTLNFSDESQMKPFYCFYLMKTVIINKKLNPVFTIHLHFRCFVQCY